MPATLNGVEYKTLNEAVKAAKDGEVILCVGKTTVHDEVEKKGETVVCDVRESEPLPSISACKVKCAKTLYGIRWMRSVD